MADGHNNSTFLPINQYRYDYIDISMRREGEYRLTLTAKVVVTKHSISFHFVIVAEFFNQRPMSIISWGIFNREGLPYALFPQIDN